MNRPRHPPPQHWHSASATPAISATPRASHAATANHDVRASLTGAAKHCAHKRQWSVSQTNHYQHAASMLQHLASTVILYFSGWGQSLANVHFLSQVWRHGIGCCAPFATLRPWTVSRQLWRHFCSLSIFNPLLHSIPFLGLYKNLDVKQWPFNIHMKMSQFSHRRSLATELTTFYLENKSCINGLNCHFYIEFSV